MIMSSDRPAKFCKCQSISQIYSLISHIKKLFNNLRFQKYPVYP